MKAASGVRAAGATLLRGSDYKPRTSPQSLQGLEEEGLERSRKAADATGLKVVSEVMASEQIDTAIKYCDMFQIGARNMQNFRLLKDIGKSKVPVVLKRGIANTIEEWLDEFEMFSIYEVLPEILELWGMNLQTEIESKKNFIAVAGK